MEDRTGAFERIYETGGWGGRGSGGGSDPSGARPYVDFVFHYIHTHNVNTVVDAGCGDWRMWPVDAFVAGPRYVGLDASASVIARNQQLYGSENRSFQQLDAVSEQLPRGDLFLCKEVVQHLSNADAIQMLERATKQFNHVIVCADTAMISTSRWRRSIRKRLPNRFRSAVPTNTDIAAGDYRLVDLQQPPYSMLQFEPVGAYEHMTGGRCLTTKTIWVHQR